MSTFKNEYGQRANAIITNALVMVGDKLVDGQKFPPFVYTDNATWDTGAEITIISPRIVKTLNLIPYSIGQFVGIGGDQTVNTYKVHIGLPNGKMILNEEVYCSDINDYDLLIGMDIITETDFLLTNADGKTTFQFRTPSEGNIEL